MTTGRPRRGMLSRTDADTLVEMARLIRLPASRCTPAELADKRKTAGLSHAQVAKLVDLPGVTWLSIDMIERGHRVMDDDLARRLDQIYGTEPKFRLLIGPSAWTPVSGTSPGDRDGK